MAPRVLVFALLFVGTAARADDLPVQLQVNLLSKMSTYVQNFVPAGTETVKVLVVHPGPKDGPTRGAQSLGSTITQVGKLGKYGAEPKLVAYGDAKTFRATLAAERPQVLYLAPELDSTLTAEIVEAATSSTVLTISGVAEHVRLGVVLGFALMEGRPRVLINLKQAQKQQIVFLSGLVSHSVVVDK